MINIGYLNQQHTEKERMLCLLKINQTVLSLREEENKGSENI